MSNIKAFAERNGFEHVNVYEPEFKRPWMQKSYLLVEWLEKCDRLIYTDLDVLFTATATADPLFCKDINASSDTGGLCAGFLALNSTPDVRRFVYIWSQLGLMRFPKLHDQDTFQLLTYTFGWIHSITYSIPTKIVSNLQTGTHGLVAHHFWCQHDVEDCAQRMREHLASHI